jgi:CubicO group peptidase (beta-lactamase class C family)
MLSVIFLTLVLTCLGQDNPALRVDEFVAAQMQRQRVPGVSLAVIKDGQIVYAKGYGLANLEHQVAVRPETVFQSGSMGTQDGKIAGLDLPSKVTR